METRHWRVESLAYPLQRGEEEADPGGVIEARGPAPVGVARGGSLAGGGRGGRRQQQPGLPLGGPADAPPPLGRRELRPDSKSLAESPDATLLDDRFRRSARLRRGGVICLACASGSANLRRSSSDDALATCCTDTAPPPPCAVAAIAEIGALTQ